MQHHQGGLEQLLGTASSGVMVLRAWFCAGSILLARMEEVSAFLAAGACL